MLIGVFGTHSQHLRSHQRLLGMQEAGRHSPQKGEKSIMKNQPGGERTRTGRQNINSYTVFHTVTGRYFNYAI